MAVLSAPADGMLVRQHVRTPHPLFAGRISARGRGVNGRGSGFYARKAPSLGWLMRAACSHHTG